MDELTTAVSIQMATLISARSVVNECVVQWVVLTCDQWAALRVDADEHA